MKLGETRQHHILGSPLVVAREERVISKEHLGTIEEERMERETKERETKEREIKEREEKMASRSQRTFLGEELLVHQGLQKQKVSMSYGDVLEKVQSYLSESYPELLLAKEQERKESIKRYLHQYLREHGIQVEGYEEKGLVEALYLELAEYGFLSPYIFGTGIEEIDINAWDDIEVQYAGGKCEKLQEHFASPEHAIHMMRRMLSVSGMVLDHTSPMVLGHLSKNIRIAVMKTPIVDEDVGVVASIRIVNPKAMKQEDFIQGGTATEEMLGFLTSMLRYGVSVCVAGATSSGKTTLLGWLLSTIPKEKRVYTIEQGSRELDLVQRDDQGKVVNSVIHTLTRSGEQEKQRIDQIHLLDMALRFNPDLVVVGEMRGAEAYAAQEAARTGVAVLTTIHANSCEATYRRMVSLCKRGVELKEDTLLQYVTEAYPLVVFCKQLENKERRLMEVIECTGVKEGEVQYRSLFQYVITENRREGERAIVVGAHEKKQGISSQLAKRLLENGMPLGELERWKEKEE